jgi:phage tail sheath gpL-like
MVAFNLVPANLRIPSVVAEYDSSRAASGPALLPYRGLIVGQKLRSASAWAANSFHIVSNADQVAVGAGRGSQLHRMAQGWFAGNPGITEVWVAVLDDAPSSILASGLLAFGGTATAAGVIYLYVGGRRIPVAVASGDTAATIAGNVATAIGKHASGTVTFASAVAADDVTIGSFQFVGTAGAVTPGDLTYSVDTGNNAAAASFAAQVAAHSGARALVHAEVLSAVVTLRSVAGGPVGNAIALSSTSNSHLAVSAATLLGATADTDNPVHAAVSGANVTTIAMNGGAVANECDLRLNYNDGETLPAGVTCAVTAMANGAVNPVLTDMITALGDAWFQIVANPYTDSTSLGVLKTEMASRAGPMRAVEGLCIAMKYDTYANVTTLGDGLNDPYMSIGRPGANASPTPPEEYAAHKAGIVALSAQNDPGKPLQTLALPYVLPPKELDQDKKLSRNTLLFHGIATDRVGPGKTMQIERLITTYQFNAAGSPDTAYTFAEVVLTLLYLRYSFSNRMATKFPRHKLADDGQRFAAGQEIMTPLLGKSEAINWFMEMQEDLGLVEDVDQFKTDLVVARNTLDRNRLDFLLPPNLINQLVVMAAKIQFIL